MSGRESAGQAKALAETPQRPAAVHGGMLRGEAPSSAQVAKATLMRLAQARLEPTPENYARAWIEAGGAPPLHDDGARWAHLVPQLLRSLELGSRQWTVARKKDSVKHVLAGSAHQPQRLRERLTQLIGAWSDEGHGDAPPPAPRGEAAAGAWPQVAASFEQALRVALPSDDANAAGVASELGAQAERWRGGPSMLVWPPKSRPPVPRPSASSCSATIWSMNSASWCVRSARA